MKPTSSIHTALLLLSISSPSTALYIHLNHTSLSLRPASLSSPPLLDGLECFMSSKDNLKTSVDGCRPTLNYLRTIPGYKLLQPFQVDRRPEVRPLPPPPSSKHPPSPLPKIPPLLFHLKIPLLLSPPTPKNHPSISFSLTPSPPL